MTELNALLDAAARRPGDAESVDVSADLTRGERARRRRHATTAARAVCGVGAASVLTVAVMTGVDGSDVVEEQDSRVRLVAADLDKGAFSFGRVPAGWVLQADDTRQVSFTPADQPNPPGNGVDNLTVFMDRHGPDGEREVSIGDRVYRVHEWVYDAGPSEDRQVGQTWMTYDHSGDPAVKLVVQFPDDLGWDEATMREFVAAADVTTAATVSPG